MNTPYICSRCSRQLLRSRSQLRNASFVSLGKLVDRDGSPAAIQEVAAGNLDSNGARRKKSLSFAKQYQELREPVGVDMVLESLFSSNRAQEQASQVSRYSRTPKEKQKEHIVEHITSDKSIDRRLSELHNLLKRGTSPIEYIWTSCRQLLSERDWRLKKGLPEDELNRRRVVFHDILLAICVKQRLLVQGTILTPGMVIQIYLEHGVMDQWWHRVIWCQLGQLMKLRLVAGAKTDVEVEEAKTLARELLEVWSEFREKYQKPSGNVSIKGIVKGRTSNKPTGESLEKRFLRLMSKFWDGAFVSSMAAAAITTHMYLNTESIPCAPLLGNFFAELHRGTQLDLSITEIWLSDAGLDSEIIDRILKQLGAQQLKDKRAIPARKRDESGEREPRILKQIGAQQLKDNRDIPARKRDELGEREPRILKQIGAQQLKDNRDILVLERDEAGEREATILEQLEVQQLRDKHDIPALERDEVGEREATIPKQSEVQQLRDKHDIPTWKRDELGERKPKRIYTWNLQAFYKRLGEVEVASTRADPEDAINLWVNYVDYLNSDRPKDKDTNSRIFAKFLRTFWAIRCSNEAIGVWNYMVNSGHPPAQLHWSAMLYGCISARDPTSMQDIWRNMLHSKFTPDIGTWAAYIHGLIKLWKWQEGLEALESLGRIWKGKTRTSMPKDRCVEQKDTDPLDPSIPNLRPVHAALSALVDIKMPELHATIIAWAESQNLCLTTYTFNILLQPLVRRGTEAQVQSHLQQMAAHNCSPDTTTFTIVLNGLVSNKDSSFHSLSPEAQESTIISILKDMEAKGLPANARTYSVLLDGLLNPKPWKEFNDLSDADPTKTTYNVPAARTILMHMQSRNLHPGPHHYTILISHYFASKPPDIAAVGTLWAGILHGGQTPMMDDIFYDRMIEGYANHGEIEKALKFLRLVPMEGKKPSWWALYRVLAALERRGEWDLCQELMQDIEDPTGLLRHGQGMFRGKRQFYEIVDALRERGVMMGGTEQV